MDDILSLHINAHPCDDKSTFEQTTARRNHNDIRCASQCSKSLTTRLFVPQVVQTSIKYIIKSPVTGPLWGEPSITSRFPSQKTSHSEKVSMSWRLLVGSKLLLDTLLIVISAGREPSLNELNLFPYYELGRTWEGNDTKCLITLAVNNSLFDNWHYVMDW